MLISINKNNKVNDALEMHEYLQQFGTCLYTSFENLMTSTVAINCSQTTCPVYWVMFNKAESVYKQDCSVIYSYRLRQKM